MPKKNLNKAGNIVEDVKHKVDKLVYERQKTMRALSDMSGVKAMQKPSTTPRSSKSGVIFVFKVYKFITVSDINRYSDNIHSLL